MKKKIGIIFMVLMLVMVMGLTGCTKNGNDVVDDMNDSNATEQEKEVGDSSSLNEGVVDPDGDGMVGDTTDTGKATDKDNVMDNNDANANDKTNE